MKESNKRIAAIDIGTNSFHLIVVEVTKSSKVKYLDKERAFLRLGSEIKDGKNLIPKNDIFLLRLYIGMWR